MYIYRIVFLILRRHDRQYYRLFKVNLRGATHHLSIIHSNQSSFESKTRNQHLGVLHAWQPAIDDTIAMDNTDCILTQILIVGSRKLHRHQQRFRQHATLYLFQTIEFLLQQCCLAFFSLKFLEFLFDFFLFLCILIPQPICLSRILRDILRACRQDKNCDQYIEYLFHHLTLTFTYYQIPYSSNPFVSPTNLS